MMSVALRGFTKTFSTLTWRYLVPLCLLAINSATAGIVELPYRIDLSRPFNTRSNWHLSITQDPKVELKDEGGAMGNEEAGAIHVCFVRASGAICPPMGNVNQSEMAFNDISRVAIVHAGAVPLLLVQTTGAVVNIGASNFETTWVWAYRGAADKFDLVFSNETGETNNQETRYLEGGPLAGDIVVALNPSFGSPPPYPYTITVYRRAGTSDYRQILHYTARSRENDGNALSVIDAEMPAIEKRLHVWRVGQALPKPKHMPASCSMPRLRYGIEWCN